MLVVVGMLVVIGGVVGGYVMHDGHLAVLFQPSEVLIIGGAIGGSVLVMAPPDLLKRMLRETRAALGSGHETKQKAMDRLRIVFKVLRVAQYGGAVSLERHIENPQDSEIFKECPSFLLETHALQSFCDTMKIVMLGSVPPHQVAELAEMSVRMHEHESEQPLSMLSRVADALPGMGIVAAVLGIVVTMQSIDGDPASIGHKVAVALVGTLLGILLCYGFVGPLAARLEFLHSDERDTLNSLLLCAVAFAHGAPPVACVEFGRRALPASCRPGFTELEKYCRSSTPGATDEKPEEKPDGTASQPNPQPEDAAAKEVAA